VAVDKSRVVLKLAHPLKAEHAATVGAEPKDYGPGDEISVLKNAAMTLINAGLAQVDPSDSGAVAAALASHPDDGSDDGDGKPKGTGGSSPAAQVAATTPPAPRAPSASS
jgi:hypothetical protein